MVWEAANLSHLIIIAEYDVDDREQTQLSFEYVVWEVSFFGLGSGLPLTQQHELTKTEK